MGISSAYDRYIVSALWCSMLVLCMVSSTLAQYPRQELPHRIDSTIIVANSTIRNDSTAKLLANIAERSWQRRDYSNYFEASFEYLHSMIFLRRLTEAAQFFRSLEFRADSLSIVGNPDFRQSPYSHPSRRQLFLGRFYYTAYFYREAINRYKQAIALAEENIRDPFEQNILGQAYNACGNLYLEFGNLDSAYLFVSRGLYWRKKLSHEFDKGHSFRNIGLVQEQLGNLDSALYYYSAMRTAWIQSREANNYQWALLQYYAYTTRVLVSQQRIRTAEAVLDTFAREFKPEESISVYHSEATIPILQLYLEYLTRQGNTTAIKNVLSRLEDRLNEYDLSGLRKYKIFTLLMRWYNREQSPRFDIIFARFEEFSDTLSTEIYRLKTQTSLAEMDIILKERQLLKETLQAAQYRTLVWISCGVLVNVNSTLFC